MVTITKTPFLTTPTHTIVGLRSKPQIPREIELVNVHTRMPKEVDMIFARQPLDPKGGGSNPPIPSRPSGPSRYFGLPMMNLSIPPLPPNRPSCWPLNYPKYVKDSNPHAHVKILKVAIKR